MPALVQPSYIHFPEKGETGVDRTTSKLVCVYQKGNLEPGLKWVFGFNSIASVPFALLTALQHKIKITTPLTQPGRITTAVRAIVYLHPITII